LPYDVVTFGETMLRLTPPHQLRIEQSSQLEMHVGGSESNVAVGIARLGMRAAWLSRLTDNVLGRHIEQTLRGQGVDTRHIIWTQADRVGLYFLEEGLPPRASLVTYDRANSAMSRIQPADLPEALFQPGIARLLHLTGITPALSETAAQTARQAITLAKNSNWLVSFDFNLRRLLWEPAQALAGCRDLAARADLIFISLADVCAFYNLSSHTPLEQIFAILRDQFPQASVIITLGAQGAAGSLPHNTLIYHQPVFPADTRGRIGRGDAFVAGFLYHYLGNNDLPAALTWGAATAAFKSSLWGDMPLISRDEVAKLVGGQSSSILR